MHLADWPDVETLPLEETLERQMDLARDVSSADLGVRARPGVLRVRLPLRKLTVAHPEADILAPSKDIIAEEVNVKDASSKTIPSFSAPTCCRSTSAILGKKPRQCDCRTRSARPRLGSGTASAAEPLR